MANYHFHFQQHEEGHRENSPTTLSAPVISPYSSMLYAEPGHYEPGQLQQVRPTRAPHIATVAAKPSEPRRHRQISRSRSTSNSRSRSHRRRTRRSRSSSSRFYRRRARSRCPSRRSKATRATHTTATEISPISSVVYPEKSSIPCKCLAYTTQFPYLAMQLHLKYHQKLFLPCSHHTTHGHKSFHPRHHLSLQAHFEQTVPLHLHRVFLPLHLHHHHHLHLHLPLPRTIYLAASTFHEVQNLRDYELIKSPSKDKRWAIRESSAKVSRFYLLSPAREVNDEQWGPDWNELLTL